uniref:HPr family phosphocarrier protein n=1 Tax=Pseudoclavibacter helvolus TaxID=255205 RepID=UPI0024ACA949
SLEEGAAAGRSAWERGEDELAESAPTVAEAAEVAGPEASTTVEIINEQGLHARPAAQLVSAAGRFEAQITIGGADAKSLLRIISLGASKGQEIEVAATGTDADEAVRELSALISSGFGEA